ncbi:cytosine deaminase [Pyrenophora seminiperda CCB06]|uniref:Cytosine deaminase n=1 Tax=Pyrenophora seminiperda CCB06 TaxID=1302712 RepID=A0A3M7MJC4_9PLEO|nr:cytosine deaminase [Pyrenophora seminiperda CCB06]
MEARQWRWKVDKRATFSGDASRFRSTVSSANPPNPNNPWPPRASEEMESMLDQELGKPLSRITNVRIPHQPFSSLWDIAIKDGRIASVDAHSSSSVHNGSDTLDGGNRLIAPSLCHAHIHLDKCFLLQDPKFVDLQIESGDFKEAMEMTGNAKSRFEEDDLLRRGKRLIEESVQHGVTAMRAFVEVDGVVQLKCLHAGLALKQSFKDRCEVQICTFAQLPLFSGEDGGVEVRKLMTIAASYENVEVLGSTPYVEDDEEKAKGNVRWITQLALEHRKHVDLHLDYFLEEEKQPLVWETLDIIKELEWERKGRDKLITLGHCTRLTRFRNDEWAHLRQEVGSLPVSFVGLPTSDLFMMRTPENVRGTLPVIELINEHGFDAAIAVNNVGNAFTPYGNCDPLSIASLGVGLYQAGTKKDAELLYETVSSRAKSAIGCEPTSLVLKPGQPADFVLFDRMDSGWHCRKSVVEVVYDAGDIRQTVSVQPIQVNIMDTPDFTEAPPPPAESPYTEGLGYSAATDGDSGQIHPHSLLSLRPVTTISEVVDIFLSNIKLRFGNDSAEIAKIFNVLGAFRAGKTSKKDTLVAIRMALGNQEDLKQDLMNVLFHRDADWGMGDFDFSYHPPANPPSSNPHFLQPTHQPQTHLPSMSPTLFGGSQAYLSSTPAVSRGYVGDLGYGQSALQTPSHFGTPNTFTSPHVTKPLAYAHHMRESYETDTNAQIQRFSHVPKLDHMRYGWEQTEHEPTPSYNQYWSRESNPVLGRAQSFASHHLDPSALPYEKHEHEVSSPKKEASAAASPSILGVPIAVPVGQLLEDLHEPMRKRRRQDSTAHFQSRDGIPQDTGNVGTGDNEPIHPENNIQSAVPTLPKKEHAETHTQERAGSGPYIHNLCGKGFSTRSKVKKHHWGTKMDDLETTTGCWARNNKPNVSWNEHPSCQEAPAIKKATPAVKRQRPPRRRAPAVSARAPTYDLPQTYTAPHDPHNETLIFGDPGLYHAHRLPVRTSFDNLLSAVNVAAQVDAPQPLGRIDSVVSHLDAQAAATEHTRQYISSWQDASGTPQKESAYGHNHPYTTQGLGISYSLQDTHVPHVPVDVAPATQWATHALTTPAVSPTNGIWNYDGVPALDNMQGSGATLYPSFSPQSERKDR